MTKKQEPTARRGRPAKKPEERASRQIAVRVTAAQERTIREIAAKQNLTIAEWLRAYAVSAAVAMRNPGAVRRAVIDDLPITRVVVDQAELESKGQLRAPGV